MTAFTDMERRLVLAEAAFIDTLRLFGENEPKSRPDEFFGIIQSFIQGFKDAKLENEAYSKLDSLRQRREMQVKVSKRHSPRGN